MLDFYIAAAATVAAIASVVAAVTGSALLTDRLEELRAEKRRLEQQAEADRRRGAWQRFDKLQEGVCEAVEGAGVRSDGRA